MNNKNLQTMEEALANVPDKLKLWLSDIWKAIEKGKKVNPKYQQDMGKIYGLCLGYG